MHQDVETQVAVFRSRPAITTADQGSIPVEMGGGEGNLVRVIACHWMIELILLPDVDSISRFLGLALSSNPEHELAPLVDFEDFQTNPALYGRALWTYNHIHVHTSIQNGINWADNEDTDKEAQTVVQVIPCYGILRPRRQMLVWSLVSGSTTMGLTLEVYYEPLPASRNLRETINRKYGKYRRS